MHGINKEKLEKLAEPGMRWLLDCLESDDSLTPYALALLELRRRVEALESSSEENPCKYCDGPHKPKDCPQDFGKDEEEYKHEASVNCPKADLDIKLDKVIINDLTPKPSKKCSFCGKKNPKYTIIGTGITGERCEDCSFEPDKSSKEYMAVSKEDMNCEFEVEIPSLAEKMKKVTIERMEEIREKVENNVSTEEGYNWKKQTRYYEAEGKEDIEYLLDLIDKYRKALEEIGIDAQTKDPLASLRHKENIAQKALRDE